MSHSTARAPQRLADVKRMALEELRADVGRLEALAEKAVRDFESTHLAHTQFQAEITAQRTRGIAMDASALMSQLNYASHLAGLASESKKKRDQLIRQRDDARGDVEALYQEVRLLEKVAARRLSEAEKSGRRRDYDVADDSEMQRHERMKRNMSDTD